LCLLAGLFLAYATCAPGGELSPEEHRRLRALCFHLGENEPGKKWDAARKLIGEGAKAVPVVAELFGGDWVEGKRVAAWILSEIRHESAVGPLARALEDADEQVRWKAAVGLKRIGKPAVIHLVAVVMTGSLQAKHCAAWTLGEIGDAVAAGPLAGALEEKDEDLRWKAAISLTQLGAASLPALVQVLKQDNIETRRCAIWAIGRIGGKAALPALEQALSDKDNHVRAKAVVALGEIKGKAATKLLLRMINDTDPVVRKDAIVALGRRGKALKPTRRLDIPATEPATQIPLYGICEVAFRPKKAPPLENPFADATLSATLVAPDDRNIKVLGFYAGRGEWKVRATLDQPGLWYYRIDFRAGKFTQVGHGAAKCLERKARGFLRIAKDNPRTLVFDDGSRCYLIGTGTEALGSPAPAGAPANTPEVWKRYLNDCAKSGMNKCRIFLPEVPWVGREAVRAHPQLSPWPLRPDGRRYDLTRFSIPFWDKLDALVAYGARLGMVFELTIFDETGLGAGKKDRWTLHPFNESNGGPLGGLSGCPRFYDLSLEANRKAQEAYVGYLLARTAACTNVYYELNNEMNRHGAADRLGPRWVEHWTAFFRERDPYDHLVSLSVVNDAGRYFRIQGIDIANVHGKAPPEPHGIRMPAFLSEARVKAARAERAIFWRALLLGTSAARAPWQRLAARSPIFEYSRHLAEFARDVRYWELRRDDSVVLSTPGRVTHLASVRKGEILVYFTGACEGGVVRVGLGKGRYDASWFDPRNGNTIRAETVEPAQGAVELPCPTFDEDLVLRIRKK